MQAPQSIETPRSERSAADTGPAGDDPDAGLLARFAAGDGAAARALTEGLGTKSYRLAVRVLGDTAEAEDVAQEAMMRLWRIAPDWEPGAAKVGTWLYRVTLNLCLDRKRKRPDNRHMALDAIAEPADPAPGADARLQAADRATALQAALMSLPERQRQAVVLRHIEGLANPEIAAIMELSVEAVESLTARGKRALSGRLAGRKSELGYEHDDG